MEGVGNKAVQTKLNVVVSLIDLSAMLRSSSDKKFCVLQDLLNIDLNAKFCNFVDMWLIN